MTIKRRVYATRQPQGPGWYLDRDQLPGLRRAVVFNSKNPRDLAEGAAVGYSDSAQTVVADAHGRSLLLGTGSTSDITVGGWTDTTGEASAILVQRRSNTNNNQWIEFGSTSNQDHFPFGGSIYSDAFFDTRWVGPGSLPAGVAYTDYMVAIIEVSDGFQRLYINGTQAAANNASGTFQVPSSLVFNSEFDGRFYAAFFVERLLSLQEVKRFSDNPYAMFYQDQALPFAEVSPPVAGNANHLTILGVG